MDLKAKPGCCEEASPASHMFYIPCNAPAVVNMVHVNGEGPYRMCAPCAAHNKRRDFVEVPKGAIVDRIR